MAKYRKKPVVIEAEQYKEYGKLVKGMCNSQSCFAAGNTQPHVHTIHDGQIVLLSVGDYIIPEPDGVHFYPCKPDIFEKTYEPVSRMNKKELVIDERERNEVFHFIDHNGECLMSIRCTVAGLVSIIKRGMPTDEAAAYSTKQYKKETNGK